MGAIVPAEPEARAVATGSARERRAGLGGFSAAVMLLTRVPLGAGGVVRDRTGAAWFPLVGALVGATAAASILVTAPLDPMLAAIAGLGAVALLTGALHLDGVADTADALLAPDIERADAARRDPRVGAGGVVALIVVLGAQVAALAAALRMAPVAVMVASVVAVVAAARLVPVVLAVVPGPRRAGDGFGSWFARRVRRGDLVGATLSLAALAAVACVLAGSPVPAAASLATVAVGTVVGSVLVRWRRGIDGDLIGASIELATLGGLVALAAFATTRG